jgi:hypothetical protein
LKLDQRRNKKEFEYPEMFTISGGEFIDINLVD